MLLDRDGLRLRHGAAPSLPEGYNRAVDGIEIGPTVGSCGTAVYHQRTVIVEDIRTDPLWTDFRELALSHDLRACWSQPIFASSGKVLGTFAMYYRQPRRPSPVELELIESAAHLAGIAIERAQSVAALRETNLALHRLNATLESRVARRTAELEAKNSELEMFAHSVSHDLREPVRAMHGFAQALSEDYTERLGSESQEYAQYIVDAAERMDGLIQDLLNYCRVSRAELQIQSVELASVVQDAQAQIQSEIDRRHAAPAPREGASCDARPSGNQSVGQCHQVC